MCPSPIPGFLSLRKHFFIAACGLTLFGASASAGTMHWKVDVQLYRDLAENKGIFKAGATNVPVVYTDGSPEQYLAVVPDFSATNGPFTIVDPQWTATVSHNNTIMSQGFSELQGATGESWGERIRYTTAEIRYTSFRYVPGVDFSLGRLDKIATDVNIAPLVSSIDEYKSLTYQASDPLMFRVGSGIQNLVNPDGTTTNIAGGYSFLTAGTLPNSNPGVCSSTNFVWKFDASAGMTDLSPMPISSEEGDSGSPGYVWNAENGRFEVFGVLVGTYGDGRYSLRCDLDWANRLQNRFDDHFSVGENTTLHWGAAKERVAGATSGAFNYKGAISDAAGNVVFEYQGLESGKKLWKEIDVDKDNWYAYDTGAFKQGEASGMHRVGVKEVYENRNVLFYGGGKTVEINMDADVDLGIGSVTFDARAGKDDASGTTAPTTFVLRSDDGHTLDSAGFIVNENVTLVSNLTGAIGTEWRKIGAGTFEIAGEGDNGASLNLGGSGTTFLNRTGGYGAYNVLLNTGAVLKLADIGQVKRNVTIGNLGGTLDLNGNDYVWNNGSSDAFSLRVLTEDGRVGNHNEEKRSTLTIRNPGFSSSSATFVGSFVGNADVVFDGGAGTVFTMNSVATDIDGTFSVKSGQAILAGTNTSHAGGYVNADDWHYARAAMDVSVESGGTFTLGTHALLAGNVSVASGGVFEMREGVKSAQEYVEGTYWTVDVTTAEMRERYGLKGDVSLAAGARMDVVFSDGTTARQVYDGKISGKGDVSIDAKSAELFLSGKSDFSGEKELLSGSLYARSVESLGDVSERKWKVASNAALGVADAASLASITDAIDASSTGMIMLSGDVSDQLAATHSGMIVGAHEGETAGYGAAGTQERLSSKTLSGGGHGWEVGGGGGTLVLNFLLGDETDGTKNKLVVGREGFTGTVVLNNGNNSFSGGVELCGGMELIVGAEGALGKNVVGVGYTFVLGGSVPGVLENVAQGSTGVFALAASSSSWSEDIDLSRHGDLALGASGAQRLTGKISVAKNAAYRFGGKGTLSVDSVLAANGVNDLVVDAQGHTGGRIEFSQKTEATGEIVVRGAAGQITLAGTTDNAFGSFSSATLERGGVFDLAGTRQTFSDLSVKSGGVVRNSSDKEAFLVLSSAKDGGFAGAFGDGAGGALNVEKTGAGTTTFAAGASVDLNGGTFSVKAGSLRLGTGKNYAAPELSSESVFRFASGTDLQLDSAKTIYGAGFSFDDGAKLTVNDGQFDGDAASRDKVSYEISGGVKLGGELTLHNVWGKNLQISGTISDAAGSSGALLITDSEQETPRVVLSGNNTFSGGITLDAAKTQLYLAHRNAAGTGALTVKRGSVIAETNTAVSKILFENSGLSLRTNPGVSLAAGSISVAENGSFSKTGAGTLVLNNGGTVASGTTINVTEGTLQIGSGTGGTGPALDGAKVVMNAGTALSLNSGSSTIAADVTFAGSSAIDVYDGAGVSNVGVKAYTFTGNVVINGDTSLKNRWGKTTEFAGRVTFNQRLTLSDEGKETAHVILSGDNKGDGGIKLNGSNTQLHVRSATAFGTGYSTLVFSQGKLFIEESASLHTLSGSGYVDVSAGKTFSVTNFSLSGSLEKAGAGTLLVSGSPLVPTKGSLLISGGTVATSVTNALGKSSVSIGAGGALEVRSSALTASGGIKIAQGGKILVDLGSFGESSETAGETFSLKVISGTKLSWNASETRSVVATLASEDIPESSFGIADGEDWSGWIQSWEYDGSDLVLTMTIPEPSAFGLLAGTFALALAASRRRRGKRAA